MSRRRNAGGRGERAGVVGRRVRRVCGALACAAAAWGTVAAGALGPTATVRTSVGPGGIESDGPSSTASISADGRLVVFSSDADDLVPRDTNDARDIFVWDARTGLTQRVSVAGDGRQANGPSSSSALDLLGGPAISSGGRFVAFASEATNLVGGDTNRSADIFVRDLLTGWTRRVSVSSSNGQANGASVEPTISAEGRYVAFVSAASNLAPGSATAVPQIFVRDRVTHGTRLLSVGRGGAPGNGPSLRPVISADGRFVEFESLASNLVPGDGNRVADVFVRDLVTGRTQRISVSSRGAQASGASYTGVGPVFSGRDRYVVFYSAAPNLVPGDGNARLDVFVRDLWRHTTQRVSLGSRGRQGNGDSLLPSVSADGRAIAFESTASNLVAGSRTGDHVYVRNLGTGRTVLVPRSAGGGLAVGTYEHPDLSSDGRYITFASMARTLVGGDRNGVEDIFRGRP